MAASTTLITPTTTKPQSLSPIRCKHTTPTTTTHQPNRRQLLLTLGTATGILTSTWVNPIGPPQALATNDEKYVKETEDVISKVRSTISMDKNDPNVASIAADLRATSNSWVAKYWREKALLGRASFRDIYSALNAVSGHYISFGPTAPIPAKCRARILEEMDTAEGGLGMWLKISKRWKRKWKKKKKKRNS